MCVVSTSGDASCLRSNKFESALAQVVETDELKMGALGTEGKIMIMQTAIAARARFSVVTAL